MNADVDSSNGEECCLPRGIAYTGINLETLRDTPIALCSINEQREIAAAIERRLSLADALERELHQHLETQRALKLSILNRAFSGQLVARDPADEPASVLLARVRAEREGSGETKRKNKKNIKKEAA